MFWGRMQLLRATPERRPLLTAVYRAQWQRSVGRGGRDPMTWDAGVAAAKERLSLAPEDEQRISNPLSWARGQLRQTRQLLREKAATARQQEATTGATRGGSSGRCRESRSWAAYVQHIGVDACECTGAQPLLCARMSPHAKQLILALRAGSLQLRAGLARRRAAQQVAAGLDDDDDDAAGRDAAACPCCQGGQAETPAHFLLECPHYADARDAMKSAIDVFASEKLAAAVAASEDDGAWMMVNEHYWEGSRVPPSSRQFLSCPMGDWEKAMVAVGKFIVQAWSARSRILALHANQPLASSEAGAEADGDQVPVAG